MDFGSIWMVGFWAVIIWAVFTLRARWSGDQDRVAENAGSALEIVERRYARGKLSDEQYETKRRRLSQPTELRWLRSVRTRQGRRTSSAVARGAGTAY